MKSWTVKKRILAGFIAIAATAVGAGILSCLAFLRVLALASAVEGEASEFIRDTATLGLVGASFGAILAALLGVWFARSLSRTMAEAMNRLSGVLQNGAEEVAAAARQVSESSHSLAGGASHQAASLEETSASLEEISSMTKQNFQNSEAAKMLAAQARTSAEAGAADMNQMSAAMDAIKSSSGNIAKIIKTIDEIAFQTNILSLNAAVEAARAGEAGMGFAVVAGEVRNLAQRSAQAARETSEKIQDSIAKSERGVQISANVARGLSEIVAKTREVDDLVAQIATASSEQKLGIQQVNVAVSEIDRQTQANAANAEQTASAAEELNAQAATLKVAVEELVLHIGGASGQKAAASRPAPAHAAPSPARHNGKAHHESFATNGRHASDASLFPIEVDFKTS